MCGDATSEADHERLMGGASIDLVLTDPPYGVGIDYDGFEDSQANVAGLIEGFMPLALRWPVVLVTPGVFAMWSYPRPQWVLAWIHSAGNGTGPWGFTTFNPILAYGRDPYLARGKGSHPDSVVMATDRKGVEGHPVVKPIEVWEWVLRRGSVSEGEAVLDPFAGSGTTIIAAERLGRRCYAIEQSPRYVQVAIARFEAYTGEKAVRLDG